ncbi:ribonuclease P protein component [Buchnera aphidicola]|uniref:Ribonuclease P protein component n=1 Tax=Buchnera aphidicola subsp. Tuberolachnus salignus TaxID=98804 RepID=A0A160SWM2_BUCTT|nr:ribonuclease P protein component [Buchnera aphidicola]CUR52998.1 Ribonuclease P protein component [Buchnera aphidicola (Tuberolachnus salignus)]
MKNFSFHKKLRLKTTQQFQNVYQNNQKKITSEFVVFGRLNNLTFPRLGLSISKKKVKYAWNRNRIKRVIKECFRLLQYYLLFMDFIVVVKKDISSLNNYTLVNIIKKLWFYRIT